MDLIGLAIALGLVLSLRLVFLMQDVRDELRGVREVLDEEEGDWHEDIELGGTADADEEPFS
jgi:hypothetical protein